MNTWEHKADCHVIRLRQGVKFLATELAGWIFMICWALVVWLPILVIALVLVAAGPRLIATYLLPEELQDSMPFLIDTFMPFIIGGVVGIIVWPSIKRFLFEPTETVYDRVDGDSLNVKISYFKMFLGGHIWSALPVRMKCCKIPRANHVHNETCRKWHRIVQKLFSLTNFAKSLVASVIQLFLIPSSLALNVFFIMLVVGILLTMVSFDASESGEYFKTYLPWLIGYGFIGSFLSSLLGHKVRAMTEVGILKRSEIKLDEVCQ